MASYAEIVKSIGIMERGIRRMEVIKAEATKQKNTKLVTRANIFIGKWNSLKALRLKELRVSADGGFDVRAISIGKKGMMVVVKHPSLKTPVTRHLLRKNGIYTGRAPFGASTFIEYKVTIAGDLQMLATLTNPAKGTMQVLDNAA